MTRPDPRSPLVLDTAQLGRRPGAMLEVTRSAPAPADFGTDVVTVSEGSDLRLALRMESVVEGVLVSGDVHAEATGACVRCLEPVDIPIDTEFQELFAYADRAEHHRENDAEFDEAVEHLIQDDLIDLEAVLRDAVVPELPFQPVCRADCPGLCSECGVHLDAKPGHKHDTIDPRWSALAALSGAPTADDHTQKRK